MVGNPFPSGQPCGAAGAGDEAVFHPSGSAVFESAPYASAVFAGALRDGEWAWKQLYSKQRLFRGLSRQGIARREFRTLSLQQER